MAHKGVQSINPYVGQPEKILAAEYGLPRVFPLSRKYSSADVFQVVAVCVLIPLSANARMPVISLSGFLVPTGWACYRCGGSTSR